jgi:hypothetical protein
MGLVLLLASSGGALLAFPSYDPLTDARARGGTVYGNGAPLYYQTNALGEGWSRWNGGTTSSWVSCTSAGLSYGGYPAAFPAPSVTNAAYVPGQADHSGGVAGQSAALVFARAISADPLNTATNSIYASFLLKLSNLGTLNSGSPTYFAGLATNVGDQSVSLPASAMKLYLKGNSSTSGQSTTWAIGVANNSGSGSAAFDGGGHTSNDVLFVVVDYEFGIKGNPHAARLWVNPASTSFGMPTPPAATASISIPPGTNQIAQAADFFLLDRAASTLWGRLFISDLRLGTTWSYVTGGPEITSQPQSVLGILGSNAVFTAPAVSGATSQPLTYQWCCNGTNLADGDNIAGATNSMLTISNLSPGNVGVYAVVVSNALGSVVSAGASLSMASPDAPVFLSANSFGLSQVIASFSQPLSPASASYLTNYVLSGAEGSLYISNAVLDASQSNVVLSVQSMQDAGLYTLTANNLANAFYPDSLIVPGSQTNFVAKAYFSAGIGTPPTGGGQVTSSNSLTVTGIGVDIGGTNDQFQFCWKPLTGDFDQSVCLQHLDLSDIWAKAGLMARASLDPASPFAASFATPSMAGSFFAFRTATNGAASSSGRFPANFPNAWLRLKRSGNSFTGFASYDGQSWAVLGSASFSMPSQVYFGLAVCSHTTNAPAMAQCLPPFDTPSNAATAVVSAPYEPVGPSSRKTGIVITEIMYKPAPRTDGNNLEFIELYNSQPFFHDVSGYQLVCADMNYTFPAGIIMPAGGVLVIAASPASIQNVYGITNVLGPYNGGLKKSETLQLLDEHGAVLLTVPYSATYPWPVAALGTGHSICLAHPTNGEADPRAWAISDVVGGSPGAMESYHPSPLRDVRINELLAHSEATTVLQFIELYNHNNQTNDLSGCILTDDADTDKFVIPAGTLVAPRGFVSFDQSQLALPFDAAGGTVFLIKPDHSRILDAVQYEAQADGVSFGRWPDGADDFYFLQTRTPGGPNSPILVGDIVINELMYKPISGNDDDQYIELYNQGANTVSLDGWQLSAGVTFKFPANAILPPGGYLVVARNQTNLFAKYSNLNPGNAVGNYSGKLSHNGERVALARPKSLNGTNTLYVIEDEVTYGRGGRWGKWASGGGSSLELIDPHANHRLAANWADSDETQKSAWAIFETTGVMDNGSNYEASVAHAQIGLLDVGECLVDQIEVLGSNGVNCVANPDFETGLGNWALQGCMVRSSLENSGYNSGHSLHIRCSNRLWTGDNSCQASLVANSLGPGQTATLRFKARWLRGWPEPLLRVNGNWLEATGSMPLPSNLGTPGLPNSMQVANAGPAVYAVTHAPTLPAANAPVVVSARVHDPDGVQSLVLNYRIDPSASLIAVPMRDDGTGGDSIAGDGVFSATIPGQASGVIAAFYVSAADTLGATSRFPALLNDNAPVRECLVRFGDANPPESFGAYHLWCSRTNVTRWSALGDLSNEPIDCTFVNDSRVIYNGVAHYGGSPYHQSFTSPTGNLCHYKVTFPDDDRFLGVTDFNRLHQPGNAPGSDGTIQREQTAYTLMRALGVPWLYRRNVAVYVNGNRRGTLMEDTQIPNGDMVKEYFPNDANGFLYKMQPWFEFAPALSSDGYSFSYQNDAWCDFMPHVTTGGAKKAARYRYVFEPRLTPDSANNFTNIYAIVDAASAYGRSNYVAGLESVANMENWMRVFAANHAAANRDSFGATTSQNEYGYVSPAGGTRYSLFMWDFNICLDAGAWSPGQNLFLINAPDLNLANIYACPEFRRMYWRALEELVHGPLNTNNSAPLCFAKYNAFLADGLSSVQSPTATLTWMSQAQTSIAAQLAAVNATAFSVNPLVPATNGLAYLSGVAPVNTRTIAINGVLYTVNWTTLTGWSLAVPLQPGSNYLAVTGVDMQGLHLPGTSNLVTAFYDAPSPPPTDFIPYARVGAVYSQSFDSLPSPGAASVNSDNPVTIAGVTYFLSNPFCFAAPVAASAGGLGLTNLAGWYGLARASAKFGAQTGDQTTGGVISFGLPDSPNRALGLLATSSTAATAFGARFINQTPATLSYINVNLTGEVWRQSNIPKKLRCFYYLDLAATNTFSLNATAYLPDLDVGLPPVPSDTGGAAADGTAAANQTKLFVFNQVIANWPPGAALWLIWEMEDSTGKAQGLAVDNFSFSAFDQSLSTQPTLVPQFDGTNLVLSWPAPAGLHYQLEWATDLNSPDWQPLGGPWLGNGTTLAVTNAAPNSTTSFYRLRLWP